MLVIAPSVGMLVLMLGALMLGATLQRVAGMGLGLVSVPFLILGAGPLVGVMIGNFAGIFTAITIGYSLRSYIDWKRWAIVVPFTIMGQIPAILVLHHLPVAWLELVIGILLLFAVSMTVFGSKKREKRELFKGAWPLTGFFGGFLNSLIGQAAPALVVYARATSWDQIRFSATLQPLFFVMNITSLTFKTFPPPPGLPTRIPYFEIGLLLVAILSGVLLGSRIARHVSPDQARRLAIGVALVGSVATLTRGALSLW